MPSTRLIDKVCRDHEGLAIHSNLKHETANYQIDVRIEYENIMRMWSPSNSYKSILAPSMKESRERGVLKSPEVNRELYLDSATSKDKIVFITILL